MLAIDSRKKLTFSHIPSDNNGIASVKTGVVPEVQVGSRVLRFTKKKSKEQKQAAASIQNSASDQQLPTHLRVNIAYAIEDALDHIRRANNWPHRKSIKWDDFEQSLSRKKSEIEAVSVRNKFSRGLREARTIREEFDETFPIEAAKTVLEDLFGKSSSAQNPEVLRDAVWKLFPELKRIFQYYSRQDVKVLNESCANLDDMYVMSRREYIMFLKDCKMCTTKLLETSANLIFVSVNQKSAAYAVNSSTTTTDDMLSLSLGEFVSCLLRLANLKYIKNLPSLHQRFQELMRVDVLPNARTDNSVEFRKELRSSNCEDVFRQHSQILHKIYERYRSTGFKDVTNKAVQLSLKQYLRMLDDARLVDSALTLRQVRDAFVVSQAEPTTGDNSADIHQMAVDTDRNQMSFDEFLECTARCAAYRYESVPEVSGLANAMDRFYLDLKDRLGLASNADVAASKDVPSPLELSHKVHNYVEVFGGPAIRGYLLAV